MFPTLNLVILEVERLEEDIIVDGLDISSFELLIKD
jgi:hypothetical protein